MGTREWPHPVRPEDVDQFVWPDGTVDDCIRWIVVEGSGEIEGEDESVLATLTPFRASCTNLANFVFHQSPSPEEVIQVTDEIVTWQLELAVGSYARLLRAEKAAGGHIRRPDSTLKV